MALFSANTGETGLGALSGFMTSREKVRQEEIEADKSNLELFKALLTSGFTMATLGNLKGDALIIRGGFPALVPPKVDKSKLFELELAQTKARTETALINRDIAQLHKEGTIGAAKQQELTTLAATDLVKARQKLAEINIQAAREKAKRSATTGGVKVGTIQQWPTKGPNGEDIVLVREMTPDGWVVKTPAPRFRPETESDKERLQISRDNRDISQERLDISKMQSVTDLDRFILKPENVRSETTKPMVTEFHQRSGGSYGYKWIDKQWPVRNTWERVPLPKFKDGTQITPKDLYQSVVKGLGRDIWEVLDKLKAKGLVQIPVEGES